MKRGRRWGVLLAAVIFACLMGSTVVTAFARELPDDTEGSITVELSYDGESITDGTFAIYKVGDVTQEDGNDVYVLADGFSDFAGCLEDPTEDTLAGELYEYIGEKGLSALKTATNTSGEICFDSLSIGLYLVVQTGASTGYELINPFLVSLPVYDEVSGTYEYNVSAYGKFVLTAVLPEETAKETTTAAEEMGTKLPQTGQLNWPIPVLAVTGLSLIIVGVELTGGETKRRADVV